MVWIILATMMMSQGNWPEVPWGQNTVPVENPGAVIELRAPVTVTDGEPFVVEVWVHLIQPSAGVQTCFIMPNWVTVVDLDNVEDCTLGLDCEGFPMNVGMGHNLHAGGIRNVCLVAFQDVFDGQMRQAGSYHVWDVTLQTDYPSQPVSSGGECLELRQRHGYLPYCWLPPNFGCDPLTVGNWPCPNEDCTRQSVFFEEPICITILPD